MIKNKELFRVDFYEDYIEALILQSNEGSPDFYVFKIYEKMLNGNIVERCPIEISDYKLKVVIKRYEKKYITYMKNMMKEKVVKNNLEILKVYKYQLEKHNEFLEKLKELKNV
jgi:hypothetical protein